MGDIATWDAGRLAAAIRAKEVSSTELLELYLDRIDRLNGPVNAVVTLDAERARPDARRADDEAARGAWRGPLHGLPITVKDAIEVGGIRSTGGARELADHVPPADAPAVARLRAAGAIPFGKTNLPRWSGDLQSFNDLFGTTNNPWALDRVPGGSSGGAAASVAAGFTAFELGTDIGGSVRIPSHCCGVFGLKPSYGVVPQRGYLDQVGGGTTDADINVFGPIARSAADLELLLGVVAGPPPEQEVAWRLDLPTSRRRSASDWRIGVWFDEPGLVIDHGLRARLQAAADALADAGAKVEDVHPPVSMNEQLDLFSHLISSAIAPSAPPEQNDGGTHRSWLDGQTRRVGFKRAWAEWFETYDALLCPVMPVPAFPHQQDKEFIERVIPINGEPRSYLDMIRWTGLIGIVELPSAVPPIGRTPEGLPVGMQVVTAYLRDREAIALAALIAELVGGYEVPPGF